MNVGIVWIHFVCRILAIPTKCYVFQFFFMFFFIFISAFDLLHYIIIGSSFYFTFIASVDCQIHGILACSFFS